MARPTPSPKKPAAKDSSVADRLLAVKRDGITTAIIVQAALGKRKLYGQQVAQLNADIAMVQETIAQVADIRQRLADVPALVQRGSVL